ncbi:MAG: pyridoxamine 5'-phosphate oxidase family protein [Defluviitaleaceae bacterium]|nr:pyridoxamine 5'-phosphate oxidase family protein [Defluviitaleaceae bacterium]
MSNYEKGMAILEEKFGNNKDNIIALATIDPTPSESGSPRPTVRDVDAYYENGTFYVVTWAKSRKMKHIAQNSEIAISVNMEWFNASALGENLGHVLKPENKGVRDKLRTAFTWYDAVNDEDDENCCFLAIRLTKGVINLNHNETLIHMDFTTKTATLQGKEL